MELDTKLKGQLSETYNRTLELAKNISKNRYQYFDEDISEDHIRFLQKVSKGFREFKNIDDKFSSGKESATEQKVKILQEISKNGTNQRILSRKSGKINLSNMVEESYNLARKTKTGKGGIRNLTPSPTPALEKLRNNKSIVTEISEQEDRPLAYFSLINGKTEEIDLPSFKECIRDKQRIDSQSEIALKNIQRCKRKLGNFEKKINGLEIFCKYNPGVLWNHDKKLLLRLGNNPHNKLNLLRSYNERNVGSSSDESGKIIGIRKRTPGHKRTSTTFMPLIEEKVRAESTIPKKKNRKNSLISNCFEGFRQAKINANSKTIQILTKLKAERPLYLRTKASLIISDNEKYEGRIASFQVLSKYKRFVEKERYSNVEKSKSQIQLYTSLLDYLKRTKGMPSQSQIAFVETIREIIEGGWGINAGKIEEIFETFSESEQKELAELLCIICNFFDSVGDASPRISS